MKHFIFACLVVIACRLLSAYVFCTFDDAFITYRYSQNLVAGHGLIYNLHEKVMGTTAPLLAIIGAIPVFLSISVPKFFVIFNILCDLGSLWLVYRFVFEQNKILLVIFTVLFAFDPASNRIAVGGMEANLFLFCSLLGLVLYFNKRKTLSFLLLSLIYFLRPEALILFLILICFEWTQAKKIPWKYIIYCSLFMAVPLYLIYQFYGQLIPQSVVSKNLGPHNPFSGLVKNIFFPHFFNYILFPLAIFGIIRAVRINKYYLLIAIWTFCYVAVYCIRGPWILNWYIYAIEVSQIIFASVAIHEIAVLLRWDLSGGTIGRLARLGAVLSWVFAFLYLGRSGVEVNIYDRMKSDFNAEPGLGSKIFFADDIGALGFYSGAYIYDNLMVVTPQAIQFEDQRERILHINPDYLFLYTDAFYLRLIQGDSVLSKRYSFVKRYSRYGETGLPVQAAEEYTHGYRQDYMLFRRNDQKK
jgi:hypothetical protein